MSGQLIPKGDNRWLLRAYAGRVGGVRKYVNKTFAGTYTQAQKELTKLIADVDRKLVLPSSQLTVRAFILEWLDAKQDASPRTKQVYRKLVDLYLGDVANVRLSDLRRPHVERLYGSLIDRGISPKTVQHVHSILRQAAEYATDLKLLPINPVQGASRPTVRRAVKETLTVEQVRTLIASVKGRGDYEYPFYLLVFTAGLRPNEALALRWSDLEGDTIRVVRTWTEDATGRRILSEAPKTDAGFRSIPLPAETVEALLAWKKTSAFAPSMFIFSNLDGSIVHLAAIRKRFKRALKAAGLPSIRLYDTRHTHGTLLLEAGVNAKVVQERLGHSNVGITLGTYAHVTTRMQAQAVEAVEKMGLG